ncbi:hypothetical protein ACROYT_G017850 [Oculina patagonica]
MKQTTAVGESMAPIDNEVDFIDIDHFSPETQDKEIALFNPSQPSDFVVPMEEAADFQMDMTFLEPQIAACPPLGFPNLDTSTSSPWDSDISDSCPASPSPVSSPSPHSSASSSESGIEDVSDMEEAASVFSQTVNGPLVVKTENPSSPLNALIQPSVNSSERPKRRKSSRRTANDNSVLEELNKLLVETSMSLALNSMDQSGSQPCQTQAKMTGQDNTMTGVQTTASPTSVSHSCPQSVQASQTVTLAPSSHPASVSSQSTSTATITKLSSPPVASPARIRSKPTRNGRKSDEPKIVIIEEPEENYRARYESEGCRGPIHGSQDNTFPAVKVTGYDEAVWITVHLTTSSGVPHYHSIHGPGSTKVPCKETTLPGGVPAVQVMVAPDTNMTAVLDSLSIRRLRNWEGDRELRKRGIDPRTWKKERKEARLLFQAEIPERDGRPASKLSCKSKVFQCSSSGPPGNPEIWWASISEGSVEGGDELGLIGKKFQSGFKVRFFSASPSENWESFAEVDKSKSHQGAAVVLTPAYSNPDITSPVTVNVVVTFGNGKDAKSSEPIEFTYKPKPVQVQEVEMHHTIPITAPENFLPVDFNSLGDIVLNNLPQEIVESVPVVLPTVNEEQDWQSLCVQLGELHQNGDLSTEHVKELCEYIKRRDTLLLQAFRSSRTASSKEQLQANFKQYLSGMLSNL